MVTRANVVDVLLGIMVPFVALLWLAGELFAAMCFTTAWVLIAWSNRRQR